MSERSKPHRKISAQQKSYSNLGQELWNIYRNQPLWPGDTLSHATANELVQKGLAERTADGYFILTEKGRQLVLV